MVAIKAAPIVFAFLFYSYFMSLVFGAYNLLSPSWVTTNKGNTIGLYETCSTCVDVRECQLWLSYQDNFC